MALPPAVELVAGHEHEMAGHWRCDALRAGDDSVEPWNRHGRRLRLNEGRPRVRDMCLNCLPPVVWLLLVNAATTFFMVGVIWFVQIVHYPLFSSVGEAAFSEYERHHARRTGWVVAVPMLLELGTAIAMVWVIGGALAWCGLSLLAVAWVSTGLWQVPAHRRLEGGFDAVIHRRLLQTNWVRTVAWSARGIIACALLVAHR